MKVAWVWLIFKAWLKVVSKAPQSGPDSGRKRPKVARVWLIFKAWPKVGAWVWLTFKAWPKVGAWVWLIFVSKVA